MDLEWDPDKAASNLAKHGVSFHEAGTVFSDPLAITYYDPDHSDDEDRYLSLAYRKPAMRSWFRTPIVSLGFESLVRVG